MCGTAERLEFDHLDRSTKVKDVASLAIYKAENFWAEVLKCQLLCHDHHLERTRLQRQPPHGSQRRYSAWGCRCDVCRTASSRRRQEARVKARLRADLQHVELVDGAVLPSDI